MESNAFAIDMTNNIMAPALISIWMSVEKLKENGLLLHISAALCLAQLLLLYVGLFLTRGSVNRSSLYISIIPDLTYWASVVSFTVMPLLIIGINIAASRIIKDEQKYVPFLIFVILIQIGIFITYFTTYRASYVQTHKNSLIERSGFRILSQYCKLDELVEKITLKTWAKGIFSSSVVIKTETNYDIDFKVFDEHWKAESIK